MPVETGQFPLGQGGYKDVVLGDDLSNLGWSSGIYAFQMIQSPTGKTQDFRILSYAFQARIAIGVNISPWAARLGRLYGGIVRDVPTPAPTLPPDLSLITELWDGSKDPSPPAFSPSSGGVIPGMGIVGGGPGASFDPNAIGWSPSQREFVTGSEELPQPIEIPAVDAPDIYMGLWLTPSLVAAGGGAVLVVGFCSWSFVWETI